MTSQINSELKKFNSSSVQGIELRGQFKFSSLDKNWTWTAAQLTIELFWTEFKVNSERVECHLLKKGRNYRILCVMTWKKPSSSSFPQGGTPLSLNWLWTQFKKVQWWVGQQFKFSFCRMNWTWVDCWVQCRELNLNWTFWTLYSSDFDCFCKSIESRVHNNF